MADIFGLNQRCFGYLSARSRQNVFTVAEPDASFLFGGDLYRALFFGASSISLFVHRVRKKTAP